MPFIAPFASSLATTVGSGKTTMEIADIHSQLFGVDRHGNSFYALRRRRLGIARLPLIAITTAVSAVCLFAGIFTWIATTAGPPPGNYLNLALRKLRTDEFELASSLIAKLSPDKLPQDVDRSKYFLVKGCTLWQAIQQESSYSNTYEQSMASLQLLEKSQKLGFPLGFDGLGNFCLGMVRANVSQYLAAIEPLQTAVQRWPDGRADSLEMLVRAYLNQNPPELEAARRQLDAWRALPGLTPDDVDRSRVLEIQLLGQLDQFDSADQLLDLIRPDSSSHNAALMAIGECYINHAEQSDTPTSIDLNERAIAQFQVVARSPMASLSQRRQAQLKIGLTLHTLGKSTEALSMLSRLRINSPDSPEAIASGVTEIDLLVNMDRLREAISTTTHIATHLGNPECHDHTWMPRKKMRQSLLDTGRKMVGRAAFGEAIRMADSMPAICTPGDVTRLRAETYKAWAESIARQPTDSEIQTTSEIEALKRKSVFSGKADPYYELAGQYYEKLSNLELRSNDFIDILWTAIECFQAAHSLEHSNLMLKKYLTFETRQNRPRGMIQLSENYLSLGQPDRAIVKLQQCLQSYPNHPLMYDARLTMARVLSDQQQFDPAAELLLENLYDGTLSPESRVWRDSLFDLGNLLVRQGDILQLEAREFKFDPARSKEHLDQLEKSFVRLVRGLQRLEEGLRRYKSDPRKLQTYYAVAQGYRLAAQWPAAQMEMNPMGPDDSRKQRTIERRELLESSLNAFQSLRKELIESNRDLDLSNTNRGLLRNSYFGEADLRLHLKDYAAAIPAYRNAANRFHNEPESLEAYVQIALCQQLLSNPEASRRTLEQASQILSRIPTDKDPRFAQVSRYDRQQWADYFKQQLK